jgi:PAS domain S-box-containing protein
MRNLPEFDPVYARGPTRALNRIVTYLHECDFEARVVLFAGLFLVGHSALPQPLLNGPAASFWAPTGIAIAAFVLRGPSIWPIVFCAVFLFDAMSAGSLVPAIFIAVGQTLESRLAAYLVCDGLDFRQPFCGLERVLKFLLFAIPLGAWVSATIGAATFCSFGFVSWYAFASVWLTWWQGDVVGGIVVAPLIILLIQHRRHVLDIAESAGLLLILLSLVFVCILVFCPNEWFGGHGSRLIVFILPILIWIAARYCPLESAIANGIVAGFAIWSFVHDCGPFPHSHAPTYVVNGFILIQCVASFAVCTLLAEKRDEQENSLICNLELKNIHKNEEAKLNQTIDALRTASAVQSADRKLIANTDAALQELLMNIPEVIRIVDVAMKRTVYMSPAVGALFGRPFEEFYHDPSAWMSHVHSADQATIARFLEPAPHGSLSNSFEIEYRIIRADGCVRWLLDRGIFIRDELNAITRVVGIASDISEWKHLQGAHRPKAKLKAKLSCIASQLRNQG